MKLFGLNNIASIKLAVLEIFVLCIDASFQTVFPFIDCIEHSLLESHKSEGFRISMELLWFLKEFSPQKLAYVSAGDESWLYLDNPRNSMWLTFGVPRPTRVRMNIGARKVMICICFSRSWSYDVVILTHGEIFNRDSFIDEVLERYDEHRNETRKRTDHMTLSYWQHPSASASIEIWLDDYSPITPFSL
jgi:hypothetical protein